MKRETSERDEEDGKDEDEREADRMWRQGKKETVGWMTREEEKRGKKEVRGQYTEREREKAIKYRYKKARDPARSWGFLQSHAETICAAVWGPNCSVSASTKLHQLLSKAITPSRRGSPRCPPCALRCFTCSWCSMPMLMVFTRIAIMIPRLKYLLSTITRSLTLTSRHMSLQSFSRPPSSSSSSFSSAEAPWSSWLPSPSPSLAPPSSWSEPALSSTESLLDASCSALWHRGQLVGSEVAVTAMGWTKPWGGQPRELCCWQSPGKRNVLLKEGGYVKDIPSGHLLGFWVFRLGNWAF